MSVAESIPALAEGLDLVPSTQVGFLTAACNSNSWENSVPLVPEGTSAHVHKPT